MKKKVLVVVDMQNDFVTGSLGTKEAEAIVPRVIERIRAFAHLDEREQAAREHAAAPGKQAQANTASASDTRRAADSAAPDAACAPDKPEKAAASDSACTGSCSSCGSGCGGHAPIVMDEARYDALFGETLVVFTQDTHETDYLSTQEGQKLPVPHCLRGTAGWELIPEIAALQQKYGWTIYEKPTFGCVALAEDLAAQEIAQGIESIELVGLCTDICVVSNALLLKAYLPEVPIVVTAACCAGVTPEKHEAALETMRSCQVEVRDSFHIS